GSFGTWRWNAGAYRTNLRHDIYFVGVTPTRSYFDDIGDTRRQGLELGLAGTAKRFDFGVDYGLTDATFEDTFWGSNISNSSTDRDINGGNAPGEYPFVFDEFGGGTVVLPTQPDHVTNHGLATYRLYEVEPGDRMPGIPLHNLDVSVG